MHLSEVFRWLHRELWTRDGPSKLPQVGAKRRGLCTAVSSERSCFRRTPLREVMLFSLACFRRRQTAECFLSAVFLPARRSLWFLKGDLTGYYSVHHRRLWLAVSLLAHGCSRVARFHFLCTLPLSSLLSGSRKAPKSQNQSIEEKVTTSCYLLLYFRVSTLGWADEELSPPFLERANVNNFCVYFF